MINIDIGSSTIKLLEIKPSMKQGLSVKNIDIEFIENFGKDVSFEDIKNSFAKLILKHKLENETINICISDCSLFYQSIENSTGKYDELENKIRKKLNDYTSTSEKEKITSFRIISKGTKNESVGLSIYDVLVCSVDKNKVDVLIEFLEIHKIKVQNIYADSVVIPALNTFNHKELEKELCMYLDIGFASTKIIFAKHNIILYGCNIPLAGKYFTDEIVKKLKVPFLLAEELKIKHGITENTKNELKIKDSLCFALDDWEKDIKKAKKEYDKFSNSNLQIKHIFITGGSSKLKNITNYIETAFSCDVRNIDIFTRININQNYKDFAINNEHCFSNCVGMSICKEFKIKTPSLLPREIRVRRLLKYRYMFLGIFALIIFSGILINVFFKLGGQKKSIEVDKVYQEKLNILKAVSIYQKEFILKRNIYDILSQINSADNSIKFDKITINRINIEDVNVQLEISGESSKKIYIEKYLNKLKNNSKFDVTDISINQKENDANWQFNVKIKILSPKRS